MFTTFFLLIHFRKSKKVRRLFLVSNEGKAKNHRKRFIALLCFFLSTTWNNNNILFLCGWHKAHTYGCWISNRLFWRCSKPINPMRSLHKKTTITTYVSLFVVSLLLLLLSRKRNTNLFINSKNLPVFHMKMLTCFVCACLQNVCQTAQKKQEKNGNNYFHTGDWISLANIYCYCRLHSYQKKTCFGSRMYENRSSAFEAIKDQPTSVDKNTKKCILNID